GAHHGDEVRAVDVQGQLVRVDDDPLDDVGAGRLGQPVDDLVVPVAVGPLRRSGEGDGLLQAAVAGGVLPGARAEHAPPLATDDRSVLRVHLAALGAARVVGVLLRPVAPGEALGRGVARVRRAAEAGTLGVDALGPGTLDVRGPLVLRRLLLLAHASRFLPRRD